jgi:hypothetical protein
LDDVRVERVPVERRPTRSTMITVAFIGGVALLALALLLR